MSNDSQVTTLRADAAERATKAWDARLIGLPWAKVAEVAGFNDASAAIRAVRRHYGELPVLEAEELRATWRERVEILWRQSMVDIREQRPGAVRAAVAVAQRAAQLDGLNAPTKIEYYEPSAREIDDLVTAMIRASGQQLQLEGDPFADDED